MQDPNKSKPVLKEEPKPVFKSGSALPAVDDYSNNVKKKAEQMFDDLDEYDDDFENSMASKQDKDFNANELLNFKDY